MVLELEASSAQVQRILQSKAFRTSEVHRTLLNYLAEKSLAGEGESIKEYTVGLDVFAKPDTYDPRQESTVRMHVARLRQKLGEYYRTEGLNDPILVDLPKGGFRVTFDPRPVAAEPLPAVDIPTPALPSTTSWHEKLLAIALAVAVIAAIYFGTRLWQLEQADLASTDLASWTPELRQLWDPLVMSHRPLILAVSTSRPEVAGATTASVGFRLGEFLGARKTQVQVLRSDQIEAPEVAMGNVIYVGRPATENRQMEAMFKGRPLILEADGIHNLQPLPSEPKLLVDKLPTDPQDTEESYALISRVPGLYGNPPGEVLYISGNRIASVSGAVQAMTDPAFARTLVHQMQITGNLPRYYQVVLKIRSMDDMPIEPTYVMHRMLVEPASPKEAK